MHLNITYTSTYANSLTARCLHFTNRHLDAVFVAALSPLCQPFAVSIFPCAFSYYLTLNNSISALLSVRPLVIYICTILSKAALGTRRPADNHRIYA